MLFLYYGYVSLTQFNLLFCSRHVNAKDNRTTDEDVLHDINASTPLVGKMIKDFNLTL